MAKRRRTAKTYDFNKFLNVDAPQTNAAAHRSAAIESEPPKKSKKRRIRVGSVLLAIFLLYIVIILGSQQLRLYRFENDISNVAANIEQAELTRAELLRQIELMNSDDYVEKIAREKLGLIKPGEIPYIAVPSDDEADVRIIDRNENIVDVED